jgi:hypothetical protein
LDWVELVSAISSGGGLILDGPTPCVVSDPVQIANVVVDCETETLQFANTVADAVAGSMVVVRVSRPLPVGRRPRIEDSRFVASVVPGATTDIGSDYVQRFGAFPCALAEVGIWARAVTAGDFRMSGLTEVFAFAVDGGGGSDSVVLVPMTFPILPFDTGSFEATVDFVGAADLAAITWSVLTPGWAIVGVTSLDNRAMATLEIEDTDGSVRSETVSLRFALDDSPFSTVEGTMELEVFDPAPP